MMSQQVHPALANETDDTTVQVHYASQLADTALQQTSKSCYTTSRKDVCQAHNILFNISGIYTFCNPYIAGRSGFLFFSK